MTEPDSGLMPGVLRTPDDRFADLPGYPFAPHYATIRGLRVHYVDEGPPEAQPILLLHGEPSWSYLYRKMIPPLVEAGHRVIAPDLVGFGRSDKLPRKSDYSHQSHVDIIAELVRRLDLWGITLFVQDWGGLIGLRVVAVEPDRFLRIVAANTALPAERGFRAVLGPLLVKWQVWRQGKVTLEDWGEETGLLRWMAYAARADDMPVGKVVQLATVTRIPDEVVAAYDAPFPSAAYKAAAHVMPSLIPSELAKNQRAWDQVLSRWTKPFLTAFSDGDPITAGFEVQLQQDIPGAREREHVVIRGAGHFLQEDKGEEVAQVILGLIRETPVP